MKKDTTSRFSGSPDIDPQFLYETREETREFRSNSPSGRLMIAVCREILQHPKTENKMTKEADSRLEAAKDKIKEALADLNKIVMDEADGSRDFRATYREKIFNAHSTLIALRDDLE